MARLGMALVGYGGIGKVHAERLVKQERAALVSVCDVDTQAATRASAELGVRVTASYEELLADKAVQAVLIATPSPNHLPATLQAIAAGKHVLLEKPMARTVRECDQMIAAAEAAGVRLMVGQVLRLMAPFVKVRELVASGSFGAPRFVEAWRSGWGGRAPGALPTWRNRRDQMWGLLYEVNIHELDFLRSLCGEAVEVQAVLDTLIHRERETEDTAVMTVRFQSGALALLRGSTCSTLGSSTGQVMCERGSISYDWHRLRIEHRLATEKEPTVLQLASEQFEDGYAWEQRSFVDWVLDGRPPAVTARDGRAAIAMVEAAYLSAERRAPVTLPLA